MPIAKRLGHSENLSALQQPRRAEVCLSDCLPI